MPGVKVVGLTKTFGDVVAVDDVSFEVNDGEFLTLLGPSGCGKTTTLRCIAGLERQDAGDIYIGDKLISSVEKRVFIPPEKRNLSMVFQSYAIWPHMSVFNNIAYGLQARKLPKDQIKRRMKEVVRLVDLEGLELRYPAELSGGQQQRVALARSLILEPRVLLLDEPLSNLDARLRESMRFELKDLQRKLQMTTVYVTHDQAEAMFLSDIVVVINEGKIEQIDTPVGIYDRPESEFVADFIGSTNFFTGRVLETPVENKPIKVEAEEGIIIFCRVLKDIKEKDKILISIRSEHLKIQANNPKSKVNAWEGRVKARAYLGNIVDYRVSIGGKELRVQSDPSLIFEEGQKIYLSADPEKCIVIGLKDELR